MSGVIVVGGYIGAHDRLERGVLIGRRDEHARPKATDSQQAASTPSRVVLRPEDFRTEIVWVGDLQMHTVVEKPEDGPLIVMLHGFPEFWDSWRYQIKAFVAAGYRTVAVNQHGYNLTTNGVPTTCSP
jgi:hypothetical protein